MGEALSVDCTGVRQLYIGAVQAWLIIVFAPLASAGTLDIQKQQLPSAVVGRVQQQVLATGYKVYSYAWPSIYFESEFVGRQVSLRFDDAHSNYRLFVDNKLKANIIKPGTSIYEVPQLAAGTHRLRLEKTSETQGQIGRFVGFFAPAPASADERALIPRSQQIEFIGDSHTVGYGNASLKRECNADELFNHTDTQLAYGPLLAKYFNADYQVVAYSGQGVVRNYKGIEPETNLIKRYPYTLHSSGDVYANAQWRPQVIVIGLGTNDFSTPLTPGERWSNRAALQNDYVAQYVQFVQLLSNRHRQAHFILLASDQLDGEFVQQVKQVVARLHELGMVKLGLIEYKNFEFSGCHWHPSLRDHQQLANELISYVTEQKLLQQ